MRRVFYILFFISVSFLTFSQQKKNVTIYGQVTNSSNGEPIPACVIIVTPINKTIYSDDKGYFKISVSHGEYQLNFRHIAFEKVTREISITSGTDPDPIEIRLKPILLESSGVTITAQKEYPAIVMQQLNARDIVKMPNIYSDVMRSVQIFSRCIFK